MRTFSLWALPLALLLLPGPIAAQTTFATLTGTVTDSSGGVIPGVTVTATHVATNLQTTALSNEAGVYSIGNLREGVYTLRAELSGFLPFVAKDIVLAVRDLRRIPEASDRRRGERAVPINPSQGGSPFVVNEPGYPGISFFDNGAKRYRWDRPPRSSASGTFRAGGTRPARRSTRRSPGRRRGERSRATCGRYRTETRRSRRWSGAELTSTNFFNHPNWGNPTVALSSTGTVGTIRSVGGPNTASTGDQASNRSLRLGLRAEW